MQVGIQNAAATSEKQKTLACIREIQVHKLSLRVQELCESRGGRPGLSVLMGLTVSVDVKQH